MYLTDDCILDTMVNAYMLNVDIKLKFEVYLFFLNLKFCLSPTSDMKKKKINK